jgi:hypothetical protein
VVSSLSQLLSDHQNCPVCSDKLLPQLWVNNLHPNKENIVELINNEFIFEINRQSWKRLGMDHKNNFESICGTCKIEVLSGEVTSNTRATAFEILYTVHGNIRLTCWDCPYGYSLLTQQLEADKQGKLIFHEFSITEMICLDQNLLINNLSKGKTFVYSPDGIKIADYQIMDLSKISRVRTILSWS